GSSPRECTWAPTSSTRAYWPVRIQASATDSPYTNPAHWLRTSIAGMFLIPGSRCMNTPLRGSKWSGVQVQYTMQSRSAGFMPALVSAWRAARRASVAPVSPSDTQCRVLIPDRWVIHSSEVSMICARSSLVTTRSGTWNPVAMNSVRGIGVPCGKRAPGEDFAPGRPLAREYMDLTVTRAQYDAVRSARHLPDVLKKVLDGATRSGAGAGAGAPAGYALHLTHEEPTPLNELCSWTVHAAPTGTATRAPK